MDEAIDAIEDLVETQAESHDEVKEASLQATTPQEDWQERNWREMRKSHDELKTLAKAQAEVIEQLKVQLTPKEIDELSEIGDDDYIPAGKVKKLVERQAQIIAQKAVREETQRIHQEQEQSQFLNKLKRQFSDFDDIVNNETLSILENQDPDLAQTISDLKDPYKIGLQSYKYIKALGLASQVPQVRRTNEIEKKLEKNAKTVQSPLAYDKRPMAQVFKTTDAERAAIYKEMMEHASKASYSY